MAGTVKQYRSYAEEWLRKNVGGKGWKQLIPSLTTLLESIAEHDEDCRGQACEERRREAAEEQYRND